MKNVAYAAVLMIAGAAVPALADDTEVAAEAPAPKLTIDNSIETLMANEASAAILQKHLPGIDQHPAYGQFKGMNLVELKPWSGGVVTDEIIAAVKADLEALG